MFILIIRIISGLRASISTHIAIEYMYADGHWNTNGPFFARAVGAYPDRLNNLYFTFLFMLRAVMKAGDALVQFQYTTGNVTDDLLVRELIQEIGELVSVYIRYVIEYCIYVCL